MTKQIFAHILNGEAYNLVNALVAGVATYNIYDDPEVTALSGEMNGFLGRMQKPMQKEWLYSKQKENNQLRLNTFNTLWNVSYGASLNPDATIKDPGTIIFNIVDKYKSDLAALSYPDVTLRFDACIDELGQADAIAAATALTGCTAVVNDFIIAHDTFKTEYQEFEGSKADYQSQESASEVKPEMVDFVNFRFIGLIHGKDFCNPAKFHDYSVYMDGLLSDANTIIKRRDNGEEEEA